MPNHPMQPVVLDSEGVARFKPNKIVSFLLDSHPDVDLNILAAMRCFDDEDREQLAQMIGYSVDGFCNLSYVKRKSVRKADRRAAKLVRKTEPQDDPPIIKWINQNA